MGSGYHIKCYCIWTNFSINGMLFASLGKVEQLRGKISVFLIFIDFIFIYFFSLAPSFSFLVSLFSLSHPLRKNIALILYITNSSL